MSTTITVTEAARRFSDVINRVFYQRESVVLLKRGKPVAQILPMGKRARTGHELALVWMSFPPRESAEAEALSHDIEGGRRNMVLPRDPWA